MAKSLYFRSLNASTNRGDLSAPLIGGTSGWSACTLSEIRGAGAVGWSVASVTGPTNGLEVTSTGAPAGSRAEFISEPLSADFTIAGTITLNLWAYEGSMNDNIAINAQIFKLDGATGVLTQIAKSARVTELGLSTPAVNNFTVVPTSTLFKRGDWIVARVFADDAGTMAAGGSMGFALDAPTAGASGDSYITFTENLTFEPAGDPTAGKVQAATGVSSFFGDGTVSSTCQPFVADGPLQGVSLYLVKTGAPTDNLIIEVQTDNAGSPSGTVVGTVATVAGATITASIVQYTYSCNIALTAGLTYHIVLRRSGAQNASNYFQVRYATSSQSGWLPTKEYYVANSLWQVTIGPLTITLSYPSSTYYLTDTDETINPGIATEKKALKTRGSGSVTAVTNTQAGPTTGIQITRSGTLVEWYTPPLEAFTLGGKAKMNIRASVSSNACKVGLIGEIAVVNTDGTGAVVWGRANLAVTNSTIPGEIWSTSDVMCTAWPSGANTVVAAGKRLRFRILLDDSAAFNMVSGSTATISFNGPTAGTAGDTYVILPVLVTEQILATLGSLSMPITFGMSVAGDITGHRSLGALALPITFGKDVRGDIKFSDPVYTSVIDDFNRPDGKLKTGAGIPIWSGGRIGGAAVYTDLGVKNNALEVLSGDGFATQEEGLVALGDPSDFIFDVLNSGSYNGALIQVYLAVKNTDIQNGSYYRIFSYDSNNDQWSGVDYLSDNGHALGSYPNGGRLTSGETYWFKTVGRLVTLFKRPSPGAPWIKIGTWTCNALAQNQGRFAFLFRGIGQRYDNLLGGPMLPISSTKTPIVFGATTQAISTNLVDNGYFETNINGWYAGEGTPVLSRSTVDKHEGVASLKIVTDAQYETATTNINCIAGKTYSLGLWVKRNETTQNDWRVEVGGAFAASYIPIPMSSAWQYITMDRVATSTGIGYIKIRNVSFPVPVDNSAFVYVDEVRCVALVTTVYGATSMAITFDAATQARITTFGQVALPVTFSKEVVGRKQTYGKIDSPIVFSKDVKGQRKTFSQTAMPITFAKDVKGIRVGLTLYGAVSLPITFSKDVQGRRKAFGQLAMPLTFSKDIQARRTTFGTLVAPFLFSKDVRGRRTAFGQTAFPITVGIATAGLRVGLTLYGAVSLPVIFGKDVQGQRKTFSKVAFPATFSKDVKGQRKTFGQISFPITFIEEAAGRRQFFGQLSMQTLFGKETAGRRKTFSQLAFPVIFSKDVKAQRKTFGQIVFPINAGIYIGAKVIPRHYGSISMPIVFDKQVDARRKTFGQVTAPFMFSSYSKGSRRTFSQLVLPFTFSKDVSGKKKTFGQVALPINATIVIAGFVRPRQYGQLSLPIVFDTQVVAQRQTFGQVTAPFIFGADTQGQRRAFGKVAMPIVFVVDVATGLVGAHSKIAFPIVVGFETAGFVQRVGVILNNAESIYLGTESVQAVYVEGQKVWPPYVFSPLDIAGMTLWLDASQMALANGADVYVWPDVSGRGNDLMCRVGQDNPPSFITNAYNSRPTIRFQGAANPEFLFLSQSIGAVGHVFAVAKYNLATFADYDGLFGDTGALVLLGESGTNRLYPVSGGATYWLNGVNTTATRQGPMRALMSVGLSLATPIAGLHPVIASDRFNWPRFWNGDMTEIITYDHALIDEERDQVEAYLKAKWGL